MAPEAVPAPLLFVAQKHLHDSGDMEKMGTIAALAALAQETRLDIFRMLVQAGSEGRAVGHIGERLGLHSTTLSFHLSQLKHAGLVTFRREGRSFDLHRQLCGDERADGLSHGELLRRRCQRLRRQRRCLRSVQQHQDQRGHRRMSANYTDIIIYHNPECGTSRNTLCMISISVLVRVVIEFM